MIYFILWYVIGLLSYLVGEKLFENEITVASIIESFFAGMGGLGITIIVLSIQFNLFDKFAKLMNKKIL